MSSNQERERDPETPTTRASIGSPGFVPPVIFAGLASPSVTGTSITRQSANEVSRQNHSRKRRIVRCETTDSGFETEQIPDSEKNSSFTPSIYPKRSSTLDSNVSVDSSAQYLLQDSPFSKSFTQETCLTNEKYKFTSRSSMSSNRLSTPRLPKSIRTEESRSCLLNQISDLTAALSHSKAREVFFHESQEELLAQLAAKDSQLKEKDEQYMLLEKENSRLKANLRELVDAGVTAPVENKKKEDSHIALDSTDTTNDTTPTRSSKKSWLSLFTGGAASLDTSFSKEQNEADSKSVSEQISEARKVYKVLQGTNTYVQNVLKRNSELELRCKQLEEENDNRIRLLHEESSVIRRELADKEITLSQTKRVLDEHKKEIFDLHKELRDMHEKQGSHRVLLHEYQDAKEEIDFLRDALAAEKTELQKNAIEWEQEKKLLKADLVFERCRHNSTTANEGTDTNLGSSSCVLALRIDELETTLTSIRQEVSEKTALFDEKKMIMQKKLRKMTQQFEISKKREYEMQNFKTHLEAELKVTRDQLDTSQKTLMFIREQNVILLNQVSELDDVRASLASSQQQIESQAKQINRHLKTIREANDRYSELLESKTVLDCVLQNRQKESEKSLEDTVKTHEQMFDQSSAYRQQLEMATLEIIQLKKKLAEKKDIVSQETEKIELSKLKEIRQLKDEIVKIRREANAEREKEVYGLRETYEQELLKIRQQKDEKMDDLIQKYEKYIKELKAIQEQRIKFLESNKEEELKKCMEDMTKRLSDTQSSIKERLMKQRSMHEEEIAILQAAHYKTLQTQLQQKSQEIDKLRHELTLLTQSYEERLTVTEQKANEAATLLHNYKKRRDDTEVQCETSVEALRKELDFTKNSLAETLTKYNKELKEKDDATETILSEARRQVELMETRYTEKQEELNLLRDKLAGMITENTQLKTSIQALHSKLENCEKKNGEVFEQTSTVNTKIEHDLSNESQEKMGKLLEKCRLLEVTNKQLEVRLEYETNALQTKFNEQEERIQSLLPMQQHVTNILARNTELETLLANEGKEHSEMISRKCLEISSLEAKVSRIEYLLKEKESEISQLKDNLLLFQNQSKQFQNLSLKEQEAKDTIFLQQQKIDELVEKVEELGSALNAKDQKEKATTESSVVVKQNVEDISHEYIQTMKKLAADLSRACNENIRLKSELENLQSVSKDYSKVTLEHTLQLQKIESQEERIITLQERLQSKQSLIEELSEQLRLDVNSLGKNSSITLSDTNITELETKIRELTRRCQMLDDDKQNCEHERRAAVHRLELEQQLLSQCLEQKEKQMKHLIETNKRAEVLLVRNAELESLLYSLQVEKESHHCYNSKHNKNDSDTEPIDDTSSFTSELENLRITVNNQKEHISKLTEDLRVVKAMYTKEIETLTTRLHFAALEQSLVPSSTEDDLMRLLVQKTTELQQEVKRLQKERDETYHSSAHATGRKSNELWNGDDIEHLQSKIVILVAERDKLRKQVTQLTSNTESVNKGSRDAGENKLENLIDDASLKCRLEVLFERIRSLLEVSIPKNESYSCLSKELNQCILEAKALLTQVETVDTKSHVSKCSTTQTTTEGLMHLSNEFLTIMLLPVILRVNN
ncbi:myosin-9-like isoform X2 [Hylaeus volcanicus]|uniref:myosin-9-like isoform X2 n=1 Tax=Hylaeus volcanicus TaxID=313075 RepID=UPI0023B7CB7A|nr:myosin-9-like isoform X2 [Hylaeus volcanicus]